MQNVGFCVSQALFAEIEADARALGVSIAEVVRRRLYATQKPDPFAPAKVTPAAKRTRKGRTRR